MPVIRISMKRLNADYPVVARCGGNADLAAKFVSLMGFAFGNAFYLRCMNAVEFVFVLPLLCKQALAQVKPETLSRLQGLVKELLHAL